MISLTQFFQDLTNPALAFLPKALLVAVLSALVCGVVGAHVVLRGMAFIGDAVAHAVFPGLAIAFALQTSVVLGGAVAGVVVAVLIAVFSQRRRIKEDTIIGIFFAAAFAAGLVIISKVQGYTASLTSFLFGSITGVATEDIVLVAVVGTFVILLLLAFHKELVAVSLDRETAAAQNIRVFALDLLLYLAVTAAVVMSVRTVGNILVLALLVTPAATARLLTDRLPVMMALSAGVGALSSLLGVYLSWAFDVPTGATVVLVATAFFLLAFLVSSLSSRNYPRFRPSAGKKNAGGKGTGRKKSVASAAVVVLFMVTGFVGPTGIAGHHGNSQLAAVAHAADSTAANTPAVKNTDSSPAASETSGNKSTETTESKPAQKDGKDGDNSENKTAEPKDDENLLTDEEESIADQLIRVFEKLRVDVLKLGEKLPAVVKNIMDLVEDLRSDNNSQKREGDQDQPRGESQNDRGNGAEQPEPKDRPKAENKSKDPQAERKQQKKADKVANAIIERKKNPEAHKAASAARGKSRKQATPQSSRSGSSASGTNSGGNSAGGGSTGGSSSSGGESAGADDDGAAEQPAGEDDEGAGEGDEDSEASDEDVEQAAEDALADEDVDDSEGEGGGIKALGHNGGQENQDAKAKTDEHKTKWQQLASVLTAGGFGGGFTLGVGLMALLGGGLFFLIAARNMRQMKMAMLQAEIEAELNAERDADYGDDYYEGPEDHDLEENHTRV